MYSAKLAISLAVTTLFISIPAVSHAGSFKSKQIRLQPCGYQDSCSLFWLRGKIRKTGEKDFFKFFNTRSGAVLDLWVTDRTNGSLPSGNGVKVVAYYAKKKGRRNCPKKTAEIRRLARGNARLSPPRKDGQFADAFVPKNRWIVFSVTPRVRGETGDYEVFFELEDGPETPSLLSN